MVDREAKYGQVPNRITDVSTYLTLAQSFRELEALISSFGRTLSDNERRIQQTLPGMIKTFEKVEKEYRTSGKLTGSQAADLKVMIANEENILKWLNDLSKFNSKTGLARNDRNDQSFIQYASIFEDVLGKLSSAMERSYKKWSEYEDTVSKVKNKFGTNSSGRGGANSAGNAISSAIKDVLSPIDSVLLNIGKQLSKGNISPEAARRLGQQWSSRKVYANRSHGQMVSYGLGNIPAPPTSSSTLLYGAKRYGKIRWPVEPLSKYDAPNAKGMLKGADILGLYTNLFKDLHKVFGTIPVVGSITGAGSKLSSGANAMQGIGQGIMKSQMKVGGLSKLGKAGALLAGPIGAAIGATAVAVGMIYKQMKKSSPILQAVSSLFELAWNLLWMPLGNALGTLLLPMAEDLINFAILFNQLFTDFSFEKLWEVLNAGWQLIWGAIFDIALTIPSLIIDGTLTMLSEFFRSIGLDGIADGLDGIKDFIHGIWDFIRNLPTTIYNALSNLWSFTKNFFSDFVNKVGTWIMSQLRGIFDGIGDVGGKVADMWDSINPFATGGIVTSPTIGLVGEAGPEAIIPLDKANGVGTTYVINIQGDVYGVNDLETRIERVIQRTANKSYYR